MSFKSITIFPWDNLSKIINLSKKKESIGARKCILKEVDVKDAKNFINQYHLQNYAKDSIRYGLYYNGELVSIMTFAKSRYNKNYEYEIIRYCSSENIIGGAEKLFNHFIKTIEPKSVISYCDNAKFDGDTYVKLGFTLLSKGAPSKHWYNELTKEHYTDMLIRQQGFSRIVNHHDSSLDNLDTNDNRTLMLKAGFKEIFDCGQSTYVRNFI